MDALAPLRPLTGSNELRVDELLRLLPPQAQLRGLFFSEAIRIAQRTPDDVARIFAAANIAPRRYQPFVYYPYSECARLLPAAAKIGFPHLSACDGVRRIGQQALSAYRTTMIGRLLFGVLPSDPMIVYRLLPRAYQSVINFGRVSVDELGPTHCQLHFEGAPIFVETYQAGVMLSVLELFRCRGEVKVRERDLAHVTLDVRWS